ncbi:hypothetical protein [Belnapia moabensis]
MRTLMGILEAGRGYIQALVMVVVPMLLEGALVLKGLPAMSQP